ncbi:unnamed protein product [Owenia fusiformis]|uniref:Uncharacterized protein n=1 Tax=Owenia fusiformis TaxID=6347 RepID=A0A8J1TH00_OWEFU|nr:unnamed protein product [Owenia fusiformis]
MTGQRLRYVVGGVIVVYTLVAVCTGHGRLVDPPSRSSMFRFEFPTPANYDDNGLNCGGFGHQWDRMGGRCGLCGDPYDSSRPNEAGGRYAKGIIVKNYRKGQTINVRVQITANHKGWFEFHLCPNNDPTQRITQECLDSNLLTMTNGGTRFNLGTRKGNVNIALKLPQDLTCSQCVLQWKWNAGNNWGTENGRGCIGCGRQEQFYGCADVSIGDGEPSTPWRDSNPEPETGNEAVRPRVRQNDRGSRTRYRGTGRGGSTQTRGRVANRAGRGCHAVGVWATKSGMNAWCVANCAGGYCPPSHCTCS